MTLAYNFLVIAIISLELDLLFCGCASTWVPLDFHVIFYVIGMFDFILTMMYNRLVPDRLK